MNSSCRYGYVISQSAGKANIYAKVFYLRPTRRKIFDTELASYFEASRTPAQEAMQLLAKQKLIEIRPGKESIVAPLDLNSAKEIYMILAQLQTLAVRFAFPKITEQTIE